MILYEKEKTIMGCLESGPKTTTEILSILEPHKLQNKKETDKISTILHYLCKSGFVDSELSPNGQAHNRKIYSIKGTKMSEEKAVYESGNGPKMDHWLDSTNPVEAQFLILLGMVRNASKQEPAYLIENKDQKIDTLERLVSKMRRQEFATH